MSATTPTNVHRALQIWRAALVAYVVLLIIGTHWPGSPPEPGVPQHVPPDKLMHFLAFGGFVMLLWASQWVRQWWLIAVIGLAFVLLDEWTQSIFAVNREASGQDLAAGALGVLAATAWVTALRTSPNPLLRMRDARTMFALNTTISRQADLLRVLLVSVLLLIVITLPIYLILWNMLDIGLGNLALTLGLIGGLIGGGSMLRRSMQQSIDAFDADAFRREQTALADGPAAEPDDSEAGTTRSLDAHQLPDVRMSVLLMTDGIPGLFCAALFGLLIIIFTPMLLMPSMQSGMAGPILYASVFLLGAMLWSWQRARLAELLDQNP